MNASLPPESAPSGGPRTSVNPPLLSIRDLLVRFATRAGDVQAVGGISLNIGRGETLGLVGESGAGKSVTGRALIRLVPPPPVASVEGRAVFRPRRLCQACKGAGCAVCDHLGKVFAACPACSGRGCPKCEHTGQETVDLLGMNTRQMNAVRGDSIAMVFQDPGKTLNPTLQIREQFCEVFGEHRPDELLREVGLQGRLSRSLLRRDAQGHARFLERQVLRLPPWRGMDRRLRTIIDDRIAQGLTDTRVPNPRQVMRSYPHELSGGMKQRVMIALALACRPELLIADEPTTAIDVTIQIRILDLIQELQERFGVAVLYISHDLSVVRRISQRVAVMYAGRLVETAPTEEFFTTASHPYTLGLLGAIPSAAQQRGELRAIEGSIPELVDPPPSCYFSARCPYAGDICRSTEPPLRSYGDPNHQVACFLFEAPEAFGKTPGPSELIRSSRL
jgi:oligopeptide/dipeptide ABC transporter ATP-binding protein